MRRTVPTVRTLAVTAAACWSLAPRRCTSLIRGVSAVQGMSSFSSTTSATGNAPTTKAGALVFLHGLGDSPAGWSSLQQVLPMHQPRLAQLEYVFLAAPTIPISINEGATMPGWFDLYDWPIGVGSRDDRDGLFRGVRAIQTAVTDLQSRGIAKIVVGGFSQGAAVALTAAYHPEVRSKQSSQQSQSPQHVPLAGCAALSGWLTMPEDYTNANTVDAAAPPLFWAHGEYDDKVLFPQQAFGVQTLSTLGGVTQIEARQYPMGHESDPDEIAAMAQFVDAVIFGEEADSDTNDTTKSDSDDSAGAKEL